MSEVRPIKESSDFENLVSFIESMGLDSDVKESLIARVIKTVYRTRRISAAKGAIKEVILIETMTGRLSFDKRREFLKNEKAKHRDEIIKFSFPKSLSVNYEKQNYEVSS